MADTWFVVIPAVNQGETSAELQQVDFTEQYQPGTSEYEAAISGKAFNDPNLGQTVIKWKGPYATQAQANTARASTESPSSGQALKQAAGTAAKNALEDALPKGWENWVLRIGEIVLGIVLIGIGVAHATGTSNTIAKAAGVAALG